MGHDTIFLCTFASSLNRKTCKALAPVVEEIANDYEGRAAVGKADVDQCPSVTARFRIRNVPTVLFFKNGELKDKSVGAVQKKTLTDKIDSLL